jgi:hypothetical protein
MGLLCVQVPVVDLTTDLMDVLERITKTRPVRVPGMYHHVQEKHFQFCDAMKFVLNHDDGMSPEDWWVTVSATPQTSHWQMQAKGNGKNGYGYWRMGRKAVVFQDNASNAVTPGWHNNSYLLIFFLQHDCLSI